MLHKLLSLSLNALRPCRNKFQTSHLAIYFLVWKLMQPQMVCLQCVETRKWGALNSLPFLWIRFDSLLTIQYWLNKHRALLIYPLSVSVTQTFDNVNIKASEWFLIYIFKIMRSSYWHIYCIMICHHFV